MIESLLQLGWLGLIALVCGIIYIVLASRAQYSAWFFGIVSCGIICFEDFTKYGLYADGVLQVFYVIMGVWALVTWKERDDDNLLKIEEWSIRHHLIYIVILLPISLVLGYFLEHYTSANLAIIDTVTSVFAVFATWLLVKRVKSNWIYWVVVDTIYLYIYGSQEAWFYVVLTLIYTIMAVVGYFHWKRLEVQQQVI